MKSIKCLILINLALAGWLTGLDVQAQSTATINQYNSLIAAGQSALKSDNIASAVAAADKAHALIPGYPGAIQLKRDAYVKDGQEWLALNTGDGVSKAMTYANLALALIPNDPAATQLKKNCYVQDGQQWLALNTGEGVSKAITYADLALAIAPNDPAATLLKKNGYVQDGQQWFYLNTSDGYSKAITYANLALALAPNDPAATQLMNQAAPKLKSLQQGALQQVKLTLQNPPAGINLSGNITALLTGTSLFTMPIGNNFALPMGNNLTMTSPLTSAIPLIGNAGSGLISIQSLSPDKQQAAGNLASALSNLSAALKANNVAAAQKALASVQAALQAN